MSNTYNTVSVLDHGFVKLLNVASQNPEGANDRDPARCARISFDNLDSGRTEEQDLKLAKYLWEHQHMTPFEMIEVWLEMKLPIFLARQFIRHRTASVNEVSGRYVQLPREYYIPEVVGAKPTNGAKQGQENTLPKVVQDYFKYELATQCAQSYSKYEDQLSKGVAPEHARMFLHLNHYTHWIWKQDLRNLVHFLKLRLDSHAQVEARMYAQAIYDLLTVKLPHTMKFLETGDKP